ncbi:MAG: hypothetical protein C0397_01605 [Odoribacter sp.]|nr:hypothetical protein [Odoribacter sp.]
MATKLTTITTQYRSFVNDQVLTADQLNKLIQYFEDQDRLTRVCLNGVGIACGFQISVAASKEVTISQGCGVTTDGDLIQLQQSVEGTSDFKSNIQSVKFTRFKEFEDSVVKYPPFFKGNEQIKLFELIPDFQTAPSGSSPINTLSGIEKMVVILYLEEFSKQPELCTAIDCNNQGIEEVSRLRVLLVSEEDAAYINSSDPIFSKHSIRQAYLQLPDIAVQRVLLTNFSAQNPVNLKKSFHSAISSNNILSQLKSGISILFANFGGFLSLPPEINSVKINQLIDTTLGFSALAIPTDVQYRYDLLKDLTDTYTEIKELLLQLDFECCPNIYSFTKHLMLGKFTDKTDPKSFRHSFYQSPVTGSSQNIEKLNSLVSRFYQMILKFIISGNEVKVTPSTTKSELSNRSIPYYFKVDDQLIESWDYSKTVRLMQKKNLCYFTSNLSPAAHIQYPLKFRLDSFDFFRIEGHIGKPSATALTQLIGQWSSYGLDFNYLIFDIDKEQKDLQAFINKNNSLEHQAGVPKGGTFLLLKKADFIIADFAIGYKYATEASGESCCKISECYFPWISSLKYLNNLSRSMKGTQSRNKLMPKFYKLLITGYSINDIALIGQPVELNIPLAVVFLRRLHVVVEKLNEKFPTGLVFDFDQNKKQLIIKKLKEDIFSFSIKDITISNNSPVYTYTEKGFLRNSRMFSAQEVSCADVKMHHKSFYQQLHTRYNPINKDDDYGRYNEKWSKWNTIVQRLVNHEIFKDKAQRFATKMTGLPVEIQAELRVIKADILKASPKAKAFLSGEWADGTWVDIPMLNYYQAHIKNTHDDVVLFMKLRERLHQKLGKSTFAIFVTGLTDAQLKALQTKYLTKADFYVGRVEGESFIEL